MSTRPKSTLTIYKGHNDLISTSQDATAGDDYFYSLCRPRQAHKKRTCLCCRKAFKSSGRGHRTCAQCAVVIGSREGRA